MSQIPSGPNNSGHIAKSGSLGIRQVLHNFATGDQTIPSGTTAVLNGSVINITTAVGTILEIQYTFATRTASVLGASSTVFLSIDGIVMIGTTQTYPALAGSTQGAALCWIATGLVPGNHVIQLNLAANGAASRIFANSFKGQEHCSGIVKEIG